MNSEEKDDLIFFGEWAFYEATDTGEKEQAVEYLRLWKKFLIRKLRNELKEHELIDEQWVHREAMYTSPLARDATVALKLCFKKKLPYELPAG